MSQRTDISVNQRELPDLPPTGRGLVDQWDVYATVAAGDLRAEVARFAYWHPNDGLPLETTFEVRINGLPETGGTADIRRVHPLNTSLAAAGRQTRPVDIAGKGIP